MPIPAAIQLTGFLSLLTAWLVDEQPPASPTPAGEGGLTDEELWRRIVAEEDVLVGMNFEEACTVDPRRVEALIEQRIVNDVYSVMGHVHQGATRDYLRQGYLIRNDALRAENGRVTLQGLLDYRRDTWSYFSKLLDTAQKMGARDRTLPAARMWQAFTDHQDTVRRAFRESIEVTNRAALVAPTEQDAAGWAEIGAILTNMYDGISAKIAEIGLTRTVQIPAARTPALIEATPAPPALTEGVPLDTPQVQPEPEHDMGIDDPLDDELPEAERIEGEEEAAEEGEEEETGGLYAGLSGEDLSDEDLDDMLLDETYGDWVEDLSLQGHRAPGSDLDAWHRAGGRFP